FSEFVGRHRTLGNRVLAFEARAVGSTAKPAMVLDELLDEANIVTFDHKARNPRQEIIGTLKAIDTLLTTYGLVFPPCRLVETLNDALTPRPAQTPPRSDLLAKNQRRRLRIRAGAQKLFYSDCDTTSLLYLSIAEVVGFQLEIVDLPTHTFLRYNFKDGTYLNWDPVDAEVVTDDD